MCTNFQCNLVSHCKSVNISCEVKQTEYVLPHLLVIILFSRKVLYTSSLFLNVLFQFSSLGTTAPETYPRRVAMTFASSSGGYFPNACTASIFLKTVSSFSSLCHKSSLSHALPKLQAL